MVLRKLIIEDFLSVRGKIEVAVDSNVTILLGANDHGKSNILRALSCLNTEIAEEERNWDAAGEPSVAFEFRLQEGERSALKKMCYELHDEYAEKARVLQAKEEAANEVEPNAAVGKPAPAAPSVAPDARSSQPAPPPSKDPAASPTAIAWDPQKSVTAMEFSAKAMEELALRLDLNDSVYFRRAGIGSMLTFEGRSWNVLEEAIQNFFRERLPRVELFQPAAGSLQDSVSAEQIAQEDFEFLQGVFFYAGLDPLNCGDLFIQNDRTERRLDRASKKLDSELRRIWAQGVDLGLQFELRHRTGSIEFLANDPAVKARKTRMSKRSAGVTQFFRLSMVLHARRQKHPANSYIFIFDEPGIYLHPKGQKDLIQVFEQLSIEAQIAYATHSLFLLNQNHPERHRLIVRDESGTKVDQKPYRANWRHATDALGVQLTANILFSPAVLLVEGDSDPIYIYELLRQLNRAGKIDADANMLGIYSYENLPNLRFLIQTFRHENHDARVAVLCDGDKHGKNTHKSIKDLCEARQVSRLILDDGLAIEDYVTNEACFVQAAVDAIKGAAEAESIVFSEKEEGEIATSWRAHCDEAEKNGGEWFMKISRAVLNNKEGASKVALARNYALLCREQPDANPTTAAREARALELCGKIIKALSLPGMRAQPVFEVKTAATSSD